MLTCRTHSNTYTEAMLVRTLDWNTHGNSIGRWVVSRGMGSLGVAIAALGDSGRESVLSIRCGLKAVYHWTRPARKQKFSLLFKTPQSAAKKSCKESWRHAGRALLHVAVALTALFLGAMAPSELLLPAVKKLGVAENLPGTRNLLVRIAKAVDSVGLLALTAAFISYRYAAQFAPKHGLGDTALAVIAGVTGMATAAGIVGYCSVRKPHSTRKKCLADIPKPKPKPKPTHFLPPSIRSEDPEASAQNQLLVMQHAMNHLNASNAHRMLNQALNAVWEFEGLVRVPGQARKLEGMQSQMAKCDEVLSKEFKTMSQLTRAQSRAESKIRRKLKNGKPLHISDIPWLEQILGKAIAAVRHEDDAVTPREIARIDSLWGGLSDEARKQLIGDDTHWFRETWRHYLYCRLQWTSSVGKQHNINYQTYLECGVAAR